MNKRKLTARDLQAIGQLLIEVLGGTLRSQRRDPSTGQLVEYTQGYGMDNKALAHDLQEQLRVICVMLLEKQI